MCTVKCEISISHSPLRLLKLSDTGLQRQMLWIHPDMDLSTLMPVGETPQCNYSPAYGLLTQGYGTQLYLSFLLILLWFLLYGFSCRRFFCFFVFWWVLVFFIKGYFADSCDFGVPMREGEFSVFLFGQSSITTGSGAAVATAVVHPMLPPKVWRQSPHFAFSFFIQCFSQNACHLSVNYTILFFFHV